MKSSLFHLIPWLGFFCSVTYVLLQRGTINSLQDELSTINIRSKRSVDDNVIYVPVYAQISKKAMRRICKHHAAKDYIQKRSKVHRDEARTHLGEPVTVEPPATTATVPTLPPIQRKRCSSEVVFTRPRVVATRRNRMGCVIRDGHEWYLTEYNIGYSILQYASAKALNNSDPRAIRTLPRPFYGTSLAVLNSTVYYSHADSLISYSLADGKTKEVVFALGQTPLYPSSNTLMDVGLDEHGLWSLHQRPEDGALMAQRMMPSTLKIVSSWTLTSLSSANWCNSFVRCGILYGVICGPAEVTLRPVYDFYQSMYIQGKETQWKDSFNISSVQYDVRSRTLAMFSNGIIYSSSIV